MANTIAHWIVESLLFFTLVPWLLILTSPVKSNILNTVLGRVP